MPGIIDINWRACACIEHIPFHKWVIRELDFFPTLEVFYRVDDAGLEDVWEMIVAKTHSPCTYQKNGKFTDVVTTVETALRVCRLEKNSSVEKLNSAIQYFSDIGREDILQLQIIYSL